MGWGTRTRALPIRDLRQIAYLLPMWGGIGSGVVFLWRRLICPQNSSWRMFWYGDLNSSHFFPRFGALEHEANRTLDTSATFIGSRKKFCKHNRMSVCPARKRKPSMLSLSYRLNRFNRCNRWRTRPLQILCQNTVRTWHSNSLYDWLVDYTKFRWESSVVFHVFIDRNGHFHSGFAVDKSRPLQSDKPLPRIDAHCTVGLPIAGRTGAGRGTGEAAHQAQRRETTHHRRPMVTMESK